MAHRHERGIPSNVNIGGHPVHPMVIEFPIAFLVGAFVTDLVYLLTADPFWLNASFWLVVGGFAMGLVAAVIGAVDFFTIGRVREHVEGWIHAGGNALVLLLTAVNLGLRLGNPLLGDQLVVGVVLSGLVTALLVVTGWYGGELVYRHLVAVVGAREPSPREEEAERRRIA
jgi:uncharacterized membrane protein